MFAVIIIIPLLSTEAVKPKKAIKPTVSTAVITNHSVGISGGSDKATYSLGISYLYQDGVMDTENNYKRLNFRAAVVMMRLSPCSSTL